MFNQEEHASGSFNTFFASDPSHPQGFFPEQMRQNLTYNILNARAQSFLPRTNSGSSLNSMAFSTQNNAAIPRTTSASSLHGMSSMEQPRSMSRTSSASSLQGMSYSPSSSLQGMPFSQNLPSISSSSSLQGMQFLPRRNSSSSLHSMSSTTSQNGLQKMSFVIPHPPGPPTLVHVYTTASPNSSSPPTMFANGNFPLSPQPMSPAAGTPLSTQSGGAATSFRKSWLQLDEVSRKVLHQVEFYFSDLNVATTEHLIKYMNKDPEGYVPISVVASFKKIRTATTSTAQLADILQNSERLVVSDDGKKVKRVDHLTEAYWEELQSRIVVAENLPEDHCHQSLMIIFSEVGSVKAIRTCQPSPSSGVVPSDGLYHSNKLHAFVEYESVDLAEKAVAELNDADKNGLKVHFLIKSQGKSSPERSQKAGNCNDIGGLSADEYEGGEDGDKPRELGRGKGRDRPQYQPPKSRGRMIGSFSSPNLSILANHEHHGIKQTHVPRMPDGTRGFSMGRGKVIGART